MESADDIQLLEKFLQDEDLKSLDDIARKFNAFEPRWPSLRGSRGG